MSKLEIHTEAYTIYLQGPHDTVALSVDKSNHNGMDGKQRVSLEKNEEKEQQIKIGS